MTSRLYTAEPSPHRFADALAISSRRTVAAPGPARAMKPARLSRSAPVSAPLISPIRNRVAAAPTRAEILLLDRVPAYQYPTATAAAPNDADTLCRLRRLHTPEPC